MDYTLYLYKKLELLIQSGNIVESRYRKRFMSQVLSLSNSRLEKVILILEDGEEDLKKIIVKRNVKLMIGENAFMKKLLNRSK